MAQMQNQKVGQKETKKNLDKLNKGQVNKFGNDEWKTGAHDHEQESDESISNSDTETSEMSDSSMTDSSFDESSTADSGVRANRDTGTKNQGNQTKEQGSSYQSNQSRH